MNESASVDTMRWFRRIQNSRRKYFFEHLRHLNGFAGFSLIRTLCWIKDDLIYITKWSVNILLQLRAYGSIISKRYNCSYLSQLGRMMYVAFIIRLEPKYFRSYQLFLKDKWDNAGRFAFDQYEVQYQLTDKSHPEEKEILKNKLNFYKYCKIHSIPSPEVIAAFEGGKIFYSSRETFRVPETDFFMKDLYGKSGQGVKRFYFNGNHHSDNSGNTFSNEDIRNFLISYSKNSRAAIVQRIEKNHHSWLPYSSGSLCTCRIVTARIPPGSSIKPLFCVLRMPIGNMDADNFALGGIASAIDLETGMLDRALAVKPIENSFFFDHHPNTNQLITGSRLPHFNEVLEFAIKVHATFKTMFLGWDIAMTENGPCVIEGNIGWGADIVESTFNKPLVETEYPALFEWWVDKYAGLSH